MKRFAELFPRRRKALVGFLILASTLAAIGYARVEYDDVPRGIFESDEEDYQRLQALYEDFGSDDNDALVVLEAEDWFTAQGASFLHELGDQLRAVEGVESVLGLADVLSFDDGLLPRRLLPREPTGAEELERARARAAQHALVHERILSRDGRTTLILLRLHGGALGIAELEPITSELEAICRRASAREGFQARVTGVPTIRVETYRTIRFEQSLFLVLGALLCFLLACALFRNVQASISACLPPMVAAFWALGFVGLTGCKIDIVCTVLPMLVMVIAFTDCVHLVFEMQRSRAAGNSPVQAAACAIRDVGLPCALTSLTTAVGFGSLAVGNVEIIQRFGLLSACSVVIAFGAVITLMPLLASSFRELGEARAAREGHRLGALLARPIELVLRHARAVSLSGVGTVLILAVASSRLVAENRLAEALPRGNESYAALKHCEEAFGGVLPAHVLLEWSEPVALASPELLAALREVEELLDAQPELSRPVSVRALLESLPVPLRVLPGALELLPADLTRRFLRPDLSMALVSAGMPDAGSEVMLPLFEELRRGLRSIADARPGISLHLTGTDVIARTHINRMIAGLAVSLGFAGLVIFGVIALAFRSMRLGLISLIPNLFPLVLIGAGLAALGIPLQMGTAVLFTVLLGLAVDDTIHFLARARRERLVDREGALRRTYLAVGKAILMTTLVLIAGFGIILLSSIEVTRLFALLACLGLAAALIGDLLLLPALLATFEPRHAATPEAGPGEGEEATGRA